MAHISYIWWWLSALLCTKSISTGWSQTPPRHCPDLNYSRSSCLCSRFMDSGAPPKLLNLSQNLWCIYVTESFFFPNINLPNILIVDCNRRLLARPFPRFQLLEWLSRALILLDQNLRGKWWPLPRISVSTLGVSLWCIGCGIIYIGINSLF